jgi:hypothetical protein
MTWQKYVLAFVIPAAIFATAFYVAARLDAQRIADIRATQDVISIDILSSETQYELLGSLDCSSISQSPVLSSELNDLASKLSVAEQNLGDQNAQVMQLKQQYALFEIKDYLLMRQIAGQCHNFKPIYILYFYSNAGDCADCGRAGDVLTYLRETYPGLRVYSFDYNLDLTALKTLEDLRHVQGTNLPAFVINNRAPVYGFKTLQEMQGLIPELKSLASSTVSTSTGTTTGI